MFVAMAESENVVRTEIELARAMMTSALMRPAFPTT